MTKEIGDKSQRFKPANVVLLVLAFLAVLGLVYSTGRYLAPPLESHLTANEVSSESYCDAGGAIVDESSTRLMLLDGNRQVTYVISTDLTSDTPYFYGDVVAADDGVYVQRYLYAQSSDYIKQGQVVKYSYEGQVEKVLVQFDMNSMGERVLQPLITSLSLDGNTLYMSTCNPLYSRVSLYSVDTTSDQVLTLADNYLIRYENLLDDVDVTYAKYDPQSGSMFFVDQLGRAYTDSVSEDYLQHFNQIELQGDARDLLDVDTSTNPAKAISSMDAEGESFSLVFPLFLRICSFWLSVVVAILILIHLIGKAVYVTVKSGSYVTLKRVVGFVAVFAVAIGIVAFYAYNLFNTEESAKTNILSTACTTMATGYEESFAEAAQEFAATGALGADSYNRVSDTLEKQTHQAAMTDNEVIYSLLAVKDGEVFLLSDSSNSEIAGAAVDSDTKAAVAELVSSGKADGSVVTFSENNMRGNYIVAACPIVDDGGNTVAVMTAGDSLVTSNAKNLQSQVTLLITLLAAGVSISFLVMEGRQWAARLAEYARRKKSGEGDEEFYASRVMTFILHAACSCDSALVVLLTNDMVAGTPLDGNSLVLMLPMMLTTIGYFVGTLAFGALMPRVRAKTLFVVSCIVGILGFACCAFAVAISSVFLLSAALFVANTALQIPVSALGGMSAYTSDKKKRTMLRRDAAESSITSYALVTLVASFLADTIGNPLVYVLGAALTVIMLLATLLLFPRMSAFDDNLGHAKGPRKKFSFSSPETKASLRLVFSPVIITLILGIGFALSLSGGFRSFLFPLLATNDGYDKSAIAQMLVFCSALAFYLSPAIIGVQERLGIRKTLYGGVLIIGLLFFAFIANGSLMWAIIALAATSVLNKVVGSGQGAIWVQVIDKTGTPPAVGVSAKDFTGSIRSIATSPVMGLLAMLGGIWSCVVLGIYAIIGSFSFWLACRLDERDSQS